MRIDLHSHSTASDGTDPPAEVMRRARAAGVDVIALTDHDTLAGHAGARQALPGGLSLVTGMELSARLDDFFTGRSPDLIDWFQGETDPVSLFEQQWREHELEILREFYERIHGVELPRATDGGDGDITVGRASLPASPGDSTSTNQD